MKVVILFLALVALSVADDMDPDLPPNYAELSDECNKSQFINFIGYKERCEDRRESNCASNADCGDPRRVRCCDHRNCGTLRCVSTNPPNYEALKDNCPKSPAIKFLSWEARCKDTKLTNCRTQEDCGDPAVYRCCDYRDCGALRCLKIVRGPVA